MRIYRGRLDIPAILLLALIGLAAGAAGWLLWWPLASGLAILIAGTLMMISLRSASGLPRPAMLAILAFAAVLPEYSIDAYYAWLGADPYRFEYAPLALAATTSSMRLIVGLAWPMAILLGARGWGLGARERGVKTLAPSPQPLAPPLGLALLLLAILYGFTIYIKGYLWALDAPVLLMLFGMYVWKGPGVRRQVSGVRYQVSGDGVRLKPFQRYVASAGQTHWSASTVLLFVYATVLMYLSAGPFAEGMRAIGEGAGVGQFTLIQWVAPLASKVPWVVMGGVIMLQGRGSRFNVPSALLTFQMAQWTLLLSLLSVTPFLAGLAQGAPDVAMLDHRQGMELLLTAAQSLFAVAILSRLSVSWKSAVLMMSLFALQWALVAFQPDSGATFVQGLFTAVYITSAIAVFIADRARLGILAGAIASARRAPAPSYSRVFSQSPEASAYQSRQAELVSSAAASSDRD